MTAGSAKAPFEPDQLRSSLLDWYARHKRVFPWRETSDPYAILVLEVMSQQTQLERVADAWAHFLEQWATVDDLAAASPGDVIAYWSRHRLGYNRRARYLHRAAVHIVDEWDGVIPAEVEQLQELDGVGPYTAHAVASFAFNADYAVVDTNVSRVLYRLGGHIDEDAIDDLAAELLPPGRAHEWNNAIMDLGATVCTTSPDCDTAPCPWRDWCVAYAEEEFEVPNRSTQSSFVGSQRQYRGRVIRALAREDGRDMDELGYEIHEDYEPTGDPGRSWLEHLLHDLADDDLVRLDREPSGRTRIWLPDAVEQS